MSQCGCGLSLRRLHILPKTSRTSSFQNPLPEPVPTDFAFEIFLRTAVVGGARNEDDARISFGGELLAVPRKFQHLVSATPLHAEAEASLEPFRRFRERKHAVWGNRGKRAVFSTSL